MTMTAAGVAKLIEECGELTQALGKKLAWWDTNEPHWDGSVLNERIEEEMGDVIAAVWFVARRLELDRLKIGERAAAKTALFDTWQEILDNNDHGIDGTTVTPDLRAALLEWREHGYHQGFDDALAAVVATNLKAAIDRSVR